MIIQTKNFGELNVDDNKVLFFPFALPGFPDVKEFFLIHKQDKDGNDIQTFAYLQSIGEKDITLPLIEISHFLPDYRFDIDEDVLALIDTYSAEPFLIYNVMVVPENLADARINLQAPIVINLDNKKAMQICMQGEYDLHYPLQQFLQKREADSHAGSH